jgi:hypothetical protein
MSELDLSAATSVSRRNIGLMLSAVSVVGWLYWASIVNSDWAALHRPWQLHILGAICLVGFASSAVAGVFFYSISAKFRIGLMFVAGLTVIVHVVTFVRTFSLMLNNN